MSEAATWSDPETGLQITRNNRPSAQTIALLQGTVWGSRATRYKILGIERKLARLRNPTFFTLSENGRELCVFVLDFCHKRLMHQQVGAWHFVMAATLPERQNEGLGGRLIEHVRAYCVETVGAPGFGFAYVEASTEFSLRLSEKIGYSAHADIPLTLFSRLRPRSDPAVCTLAEEDRETVLGALDTLYSDHELSDFETTLRPDAYLAIREDGQILAGVQTEVLRWSVQSMPGLAGYVLLKVLPHMPGWNRFLDLADLRIVRFTNMLMPVGSETALLRVLATALARHSARVGLIMLDRRSPVLKRLLAQRKLGLLSGALSGSARLHIDVADMPERMLARLKDRPLLVSAGDVM
ncbi:GNAT family N-acetyltransferase [Halovulum sp. GXIMD14794]